MVYGRRRLGVAVVAGVLVVFMVWLLAATPAFAQESPGVQYGDNTTITNTALCQNIIGELNIGDINQSANVSANAQYNSVAITEVAQELGITIAQVNECLNIEAAEDDGDDNGDGDGDDNGDGDNGADGDDVDDVADANDDVAEDVIDSTIPEKEKGLLPVTGGMPLLGGGGAILGLALIGTGLSILRSGTRRRA
jgi:hypothetical protein